MQVKTVPLHVNHVIELSNEVLVHRPCSKTDHINIYQVALVYLVNVHVNHIIENIPNAIRVQISVTHCLACLYPNEYQNVLDAIREDGIEGVRSLIKNATWYVNIQPEEILVDGTVGEMLEKHINTQDKEPAEPQVPLTPIEIAKHYEALTEAVRSLFKGESYILELVKEPIDTAADTVANRYLKAMYGVEFKKR